MSRKKTGTKPARTSWRDIKQGNRRPGQSRITRQRKLILVFKLSLFVLVAGAFVSGLLGLYYLRENTFEERKTLVREREARLDFSSDGVLGADWFRGTFGEALRMDVREIDVTALKKALEEVGQVESASVTVRLPETLEVRVREREPVMRARIRDANERAVLLLLARDGTPYRGRGYPVDTLRRLPGVAGLRIQRSAEGDFARVAGIEAVADLLEAAKRLLPAVYRHWRIIDLRDWDPGREYRPPLVRVKSAQIEEIVFTTEGIVEQLRRLGEILDHSQRYQMGKPTYIDLSYSGEAVIRYD
ncbi:MAG: hypothetical protein R6V45_05825 [Oceanipulchritudo sp.]